MTDPTSPGHAPEAGTLRDGWLMSLCLARALMYAIFMVYAACIPVLLEAWDMSATQAGTISGAFMFAYAGSLVVSAWLAGRIGARRVFILSSWASGVTALAFGFFAHDFVSALVLFALAATFQGGNYTPAVMLFADRYPSAVRGRAVGMLIASTSIGYAFSLLVSGALLETGGYRLAFAATGMLPLAGAAVAAWGLRRTPNVVHAHERDMPSRRALMGNPDAVRLIAGYTGHSWELLGMWQWLPAFLAASFALGGSGVAEAAARGATVSALMHLLGSYASSSMGSASDRFGRRRVLLALAAASTVLSFSIGWLVAAPFALLLALALVYGFTAIGDSPVLSTTLTEAVPPAHLGAALATRSLTGFTGGALAPVLFGAVLDLVRPDGSPALAWGLAFWTLGAGGVVATWCAFRLGHRRRA